MTTRTRATCYGKLRMLRKEMPVLSALAILLLPVCSAQQQATTAANAASAKEGTAIPSVRGRILGIGGIFFKSANQQQVREWYNRWRNTPISLRTLNAPLIDHGAVA